MNDNSNLYDIKNQRVLDDGTTIETFSKQIISCNIITVEAGTTGRMGGDSGHGGRTYFRISDDASTDMNCNVNGESCGHACQIEIMFGGDCELETFIEALEFAAETLKRQTERKPEKSKKELRQEVFRSYLSDVIKLYHDNGNLKYMSDCQKTHRVAAITKTQFFECGLNEASRDGVFMLDQELCNKIYEYILDRTKTIPAPRYKNK